MAEGDWTFFNDGLGVATVDRGVTNGIARPNGGGSFLFGFNSLASSEGVVALHNNQVGFVPLPSGVSVRAAVKRGLSGGPTNFAPFLIAGAQGNSVNDLAYMFGLADGDPHHVILKKATIANGLLDEAPVPATNGVLLRSVATYAPDTWLHLRLDMIVNGTGDVELECYENDLDTNDVDSPVWNPISGMASFIDDTLGVNSGSAPFTSGRAGFGFHSKDVTRRGFFDHLEVFKQN